jgi:ribosome biogenesis GTP-binding protein YsxC/EngB
MLNLNRAEFVLSAASPKDFIRDGRPQLVFAGRSNVGKSSLINKLLNRKNFARVGNTPGKTAHINYFRVDSVYFVDLPGYGYAKVPKAERDRWARLMESYFREQLVTVGVLIVDARHTPTADDRTMADWFRGTGKPLIVAANKMDKLKKSEYEEKLEDIRCTLELDADMPLLLVSADNGTGRGELLNLLEAQL